MLKIGKGLKKKKKSKKNKHKDEDLFTEEELERYRKEHAQKPEETVEEAGEAKEEGAGKSEEFEKFKLLTAGVDDILRKSQGDLDRIKKESFFQRKPTPSEIKAQEDKEKAAQEESKGNWIGFEEGKVGGKDQLGVPEEHPEDSESEYEYEDNDDLFDTAYVEALETGEVKLAYIPDDDELGLDDGPDPFDTTTADQILKKVEEEEKRKKKQISLGVAVDVLTGRAERDKSLLEETGVVTVTTTQVVKPRNRPRKIQDFSLLGSFDSNGNPELPTTPLHPDAPAALEAPKSLLDDDLNLDCDLPEGDALITEVLVKQRLERKKENSEETATEKENLDDIVAEFDVADGEFTPAAVAPLVEENKALLEEGDDEFDDEFAVLAATSVANQKLDEELQEFEAVEEDPFDTSAAVEVLKEEPERVDLFGSLEGESSLAAARTPLAPESKVSTEAWSKFDEQEPEEVDPFDTSFVSGVQPGKCELKLLENEILGDLTKNFRQHIHQEARILSRSNSDFDKDGEEKKFVQKVCIQITDPSGLVETQRGSESEPGEGDLVSLNFSHRDLLGGSTTDLSKLGDEPLPPRAESPHEDFSRYSDPFDTSLVDQVALPGRAELKFIEKELLEDLPQIEETFEDEEFDPRAGEESQTRTKQVAFEVVSPVTPDLLSSVREEGARPLTPYYADPETVEPEALDLDDPFDTSYVTSLPGKQELKLIEQELEKVASSEIVYVPVHEKLGITESPDVATALTNSLSDHDFNPREDNLDLAVEAPPTISEVPKLDLLAVEEEIDTKALTPAVEEDLAAYIDPFDTSIAENIAPGKAELRVLEKELVTDEEGRIKRSYTDPDFNPRTGLHAKEPTEDILSIPEPASGAKPLTPVDFSVGGTFGEEDIDPFDTSIASNLVPGKAELRILESELFG